MPDVTALKRGFYGGMIREAGEAFHFILAEGEKLPRWVEAEVRKVRGKGAAKVQEAGRPQDLGPGPDNGDTPPAKPAGNGVQEALGLPPDWVDPRAEPPKPASA
jgi:hypothetical protein